MQGPMSLFQGALMQVACGLGKVTAQNKAPEEADPALCAESAKKSKAAGLPVIGGSTSESVPLKQVFNDMRGYFSRNGHAKDLELNAAPTQMKLPDGQKMRRSVFNAFLHLFLASWDPENLVEKRDEFCGLVSNADVSDDSIRELQKRTKPHSLAMGAYACAIGAPTHTESGPKNNNEKTTKQKTHPRVLTQLSSLSFAIFEPGEKPLCASGGCRPLFPFDIDQQFVEKFTAKEDTAQETPSSKGKGQVLKSDETFWQTLMKGAQVKMPYIIDYSAGTIG